MIIEKILMEFMEYVWNKQRKDLVVNYIDKGYKIHLNPGYKWEGKKLDHEEFIKRLDFSFDSFPDMNFEIYSAIAGKENVAINWTLKGKNLGKIEELPRFVMDYYH